MVQPVAQLLAGLEERDVLLADIDTVAGARIAPDAGVAALDRERPETTQLDPVTARQGQGDLIEDRGHDDLHIALVEMRVVFSKPLDELRLRHCVRNSAGGRGRCNGAKAGVDRQANPLVNPLSAQLFWSESSSPR